jgi:large subunit ribosomal protein L30
MMGLLLVVNVHGAINSSSAVREALGQLKVIRKFSASVVGDDPPTLGMLKLCKDYVAWSPVDAPLLTELLEKKGMASTTRPLDAAALKKMGYKKPGDIAQKMIKEEIRMSAVEGLVPYFRLPPPKGGFKRSLRRQYTEKGTLGANPNLQEIIRRML